MKEEVKQNLEKLISGLSDEESKAVVEASRIKDPVLALRDTTARFISQRFDKLEEESSFLKEIKDAILLKVKSGEADLSALMTLMNQTKMRETEAVESILQFFKPGGEGSSSLLNNPSESEEGLNVDSKTLKTLDLLRRVLEKAQGENNDTGNS